MASSELISTEAGTSGCEPWPAVSLPSTSTVSGVAGAVRPSSSRSVATTGEKTASRVASARLSAYTPRAVTPTEAVVSAKPSAGSIRTVPVARSICQVPTSGMVTEVPSSASSASAGREAGSKARESSRTSRRPAPRSKLISSPGVPACARDIMIG